jgi:NAD(P)-dependent dehydrogenase (short-subunit alcohol dehydrogenase family)
MSKLKGKVAVVTGANSGIGFAISRLFASEGASVVLVGRREEAVKAAERAIGKHATGIVGDVADLETHYRVAKFVKERFDGVDIYVANAGTIVLTGTADVDVAEYDTQFAINARGVFFGVQSILPLLREGGTILLTSSIASTKVLEGHAVYSGTKAAVEAFARSWAIELKARRIRVNVLSPGPVNTPILEKLGVTPTERPAFEAGLSAAIPLGRLGEAEEIAQAALFLAGSDGSFVNGISLRVDGGLFLA